MALQDLTPQLRTRLSRMERAVGWFVFLAAALLLFGFGYYIYQTATSRGWFVIKAPFFTYVHSAAGLKPGDDVMMMGFAVGNIRQVEPTPPGSRFNVKVTFDVRDPYFRYIWQHGSYVQLNGGFLPSQSTFEITRGTNGYAWCVTQPVSDKTVDEARQLVAAAPGHWQLSQDVLDADSNIVYNAYTFLDASNLDQIAGLYTVQPGRLVKISEMVAPSNTICIYDNTVNRDHVVGSWHESRHRYVEFTPKRDSAYLPVVEPVGVGDRLGQVVAQVQQALPNFLALTNQLNRILNNTADTTSNLNATLVAVRPVMANVTAMTSLMRQPGGVGTMVLGADGPARVGVLLTNVSMTLTNVNALLVNTDTNLNDAFAGVLQALDHVANITSNLDAQVDANGTMLTGIDKTIHDTDDFIQGLKRHWLLRSAFKKPKTTATNNVAH